MAYPLYGTLQAVASSRDRLAIGQVLQAPYNGLSSKSLATAGLVIKAGGSTLVKTGATAYYAIVSGALVTKAAATDMPALVGTVNNATFNVFVFTVNKAGTLATTMGTAASTLAGVKFPAIPTGVAVLGFIVVNPTGTGNFVGGTTALDDATVVPNVAYISTLGAFDQTATI